MVRGMQKLPATDVPHAKKIAMKAAIRLHRVGVPLIASSTLADARDFRA
jgi:hypothetical protein